MEEIPPSTANATPMRLQRKGGLTQKPKSVTFHCNKLYKEYSTSQGLDFKSRARRASKFTRTFEQFIRSCNPSARKNIWMQINRYTKESEDQQLTEEEKSIGLTIMRQSPKSYKFLQRIYMLPSKNVLNQVAEDQTIEAANNRQMLETIKRKVSSWVFNKKYCAVTFDQVALGNTRETNCFGDHALVFILRGALHQWLQPIAFYCCKGPISGMKLKHIIKDVVSSVSDTGLIPVALICDQNVAFRSALKSLKKDTRREQFEASERIRDVIKIKEHNLSLIYNPLNLLKGLRNNFLKKNLKYDGKICKWSDIVTAYRRGGPRRLPLHNLHDEDVIPDQIKKTKVGNCAKVFSATVAAILFVASTFEESDEAHARSTMINTAELIEFLVSLFDSATGTMIQPLLNQPGRMKPLRTAVVMESAHHEFWNEAIAKIKKMAFVDDNGRETVVPTLKNWVTTLESYQRLWQYFKSRIVAYMFPGYLNSDLVRNFFQILNTYKIRSSESFKLALKIIITDPSLLICEGVLGRKMLQMEFLLKREELSLDWITCDI